MCEACRAMIEEAKLFDPEEADDAMKARLDQEKHQKMMEQSFSSK